MRFLELLNEIKLSDGDMPAHARSPIVQIFRTTKFEHPQYGTIEITSDHLKKFKENFDNKVRRQDIPIDYFHENEGLAAGWIKELFFNEGDTELWARVEWTKNALQKLNERELRYFSPEFAFKWTDPETKVSYDNVLFGGGLTNRPQVKDMAPIILKEKQGDKMEEKVKELEAQVIKLGGDLLAAQGMAGEMKGQMEAMQPQMVDKDAMISQLQAQIADLQAQLQMQANEKQKMFKEAEFATLLSEGKACAAQKDAYISGDMAEFVKNAQPINLSEKGNSESAPAPVTGDDATDKVMKLAEEKVKADKISLGSAISLVLKENVDLAKEFNK